MMAKITDIPNVQCIAHWIANIATHIVATIPVIIPAYFIMFIFYSYSTNSSPSTLTYNRFMSVALISSTSYELGVK